MRNATLIGLFAVLSAAASSQAAIRITEIAPWASGNSSLGADWFELTNTGPSAVNITGWRMDDNSNSFGSSVALNGITSIAVGESVIFTESSSSLAATFKTLWFGANPPAGLQIGNYSGSGVGLSTAGDAVNIYNAVGALQANVTFGVSDATPPFQTFDNSAGANAGAVSLFSVSGVNNAFVAAGTTGEVGSPGLSTVVVPEPTALALIAPAALALTRRRRA